ncbi:MAG TPA: 5-oxoprolinase subunit PxpA [Mycobacteriales bacterium]|jgi:UPF0271 protein|nr:5-oxoprolinase subunit PxpA [Mycobacteriales bacterium]
MTEIDLNSDLAEGFGIWTLGDDAALLELVTSANVACGFHGGDPGIMRRTCARAVERGVAIGAQVSYRDLAGFGRRKIDMPRAELTDDVLYQLGALDGFARVAGDRVRYVKPHGALYNAIVDDAEQAAALVDAITLYDPALPVLGLPGSQWLAQAEAAGLTAVREFFADRAYTPEGRLVSRRLPGAVLHDPGEVADRCAAWLETGTVTAIDGSTVDIQARSVCVHGDTPGAVEMARRVTAALTAAGATLSRFADGAAEPGGAG